VDPRITKSSDNEWSLKAVFPKLYVATPWGGADYVREGVGKLEKKTEKKKTKIPDFY
jgi:hypothetical protein